MTEIIFEVTEDEVDGGYSASAIGYGIHTQGDSMEEIRRNVREAVDCYFDEGMEQPGIIRLHFVRDEVLGPVKLPRNVNGRRLTVALRRLGYEVVRQRGSHIRMTTQVGGEHHEVIPDHNPIRVKTLSSILKSVARHHGMTVDDLLAQLDL